MGAVQSILDNSPPDLKAQILAEIEKLKDQGLSEQEIQKQLQEKYLGK